MNPSFDVRWCDISEEGMLARSDGKRWRNLLIYLHSRRTTGRKLIHCSSKAKQNILRNSSLVCIGISQN
jgi:hypothetical protein